MPTKIKPKRGSGSPAGSLEQYEIAMDVNTKTLYVSTDGVDAVVLAQNISNNTTDDLAEGSNEYYTDAKVDARIALIDTISDLTITNEFETEGLTTLGKDLDGLDRVTISTDSVKILADYSHPLHLYGEPGVENGNVKLWAFGGFGGVLDAVALTTEGNNEFLRLATYDEGDGDDGSHATVMLLRGGGGNYLYSRDTGGGLGNNVPLQVRAQEFDVRADDAVILQVNNNTIIEVTDAEVIVNQPINSTADITSEGTITGDVVAADSNITAGGDITADGDLTGNSIAVGTGNFFNDAGTVNGNYLNMQSQPSYSSTAQFVHTLNTDDTFHQFIRFRTDMTDQTPYSHSFTFFGSTISDDLGVQDIASVEYRYEESGWHQIGLLAEAQINDIEMPGMTVISATQQRVKFDAPARLYNVELLASAPADPGDGDRYLDTTDGKLKIYADGWEDINPDFGDMLYDSTNNRTLIFHNTGWRAVTTTAI